MADLCWTAALSVGVAAMDDQHRRMIETLDRLIGLAATGDEAAMADTFADLLGIARDHFSAEETLMRACDVPDLAAHRDEHARLFQDAETLWTRFRDADDIGRRRILDVLAKWLMRHLIVRDLRYRPYAIGHPAAGDQPTE